MFERAIEMDPSFARAYTELSMAYSWMYHMSFDHTQKILAKAKQAVNRAFQIQPDLPEAHIAMGYYHHWGYKNYEQALREFSIARKALPNNKLLLSGFAAVYGRQGRFHEALQGHLKVLDLDPRDASSANTIAMIYDALNEFTEAQRYFDLAISLAPDYSSPYFTKVWSYLKWTGDTKGARALIMKIPDENKRKGHLQMVEMLERNYQSALDLLPSPNNSSYENAIRAGDCYRLMHKPEKARASYNTARVELEKLIQEIPDDPDLRSLLSLAYAGLNRKEEAIREAKKTVEMYPISKDAGWGPWYVKNLAIVYVMVGEYELALDQIEYLISIHAFGLYGVSVPLLRIDPAWDPLRNNPRFQKLMKMERAS
jgi:serine/threonine-protein kinase